MTNGRPATDPPDPADSLLRSNVDIPARGAVKGPIRPGNGPDLAMVAAFRRA